MTDTTTPAPTLTERDRWEWIRPVLLVLGITLPIAITIVVTFDEDLSGRSKLFALAGALAFAGWTALLDRRACRSHDEGDWRWPVLYLAGAFILFGALVLVHPMYFFLTFFLYWRIFSILELPPAIAAAVVLSIETVALQLHYAHGSIGDNPSVIIGGTISIAFGILLSVWIGGIIEQSKDRATLITELETTRAEVAELHRSAGAEAERARLSYEIHDTLAQGFTSIVMLAQAADAAVGTDPERATQHLAAIERTARENLAEARALVEGGLPAPLERTTLADAVVRLTERIGTELDIDATARVQGDPHPLPSATEVALLRAAQEALSNVRKHAAANKVTVTLAYDDDGATLEVTDDGRGFDVPAVEASSDGVGLRGLRSRVAPLHGSVDVRSSIGHGTTVTVQVAT